MSIIKERENVHYVDDDTVYTIMKTEAGNNIGGTETTYTVVREDAYGEIAIKIMGLEEIEKILQWERVDVQLECKRLVKALK